MTENGTTLDTYSKSTRLSLKKIERTRDATESQIKSYEDQQATENSERFEPQISKLRKTLRSLDGEVTKVIGEERRIKAKIKLDLEKAKAENAEKEKETARINSQFPKSDSDECFTWKTGTSGDLNEDATVRQIFNNFGETSVDDIPDNTMRDAIVAGLRKVPEYEDELKLKSNQLMLGFMDVDLCFLELQRAMVKHCC